MSDQDFLDVLDDHFNVDGPHSRERAIEAARAEVVLARFLNHATLPGSRAERTLEWASTIDSLVGNLAATAYSQDQLLGQLALQLQRLGREDPTLYDERRDEAHPATETAISAAGVLIRAASLARQLGEVLNEAQGYTFRLGND